MGFQLHYTPYGQAVTEHSQMALYFYEDRPNLVMRNCAIANKNLTIPANTENWQQQAYILKSTYHGHVGSKLLFAMRELPC